MNIIVCIKQVPGTSKIEMDPDTGVLKRNGIDSKMNPFDLYALETALQLQNSVNGNVRVITMGPDQAVEILREAYMMGADEAVLLSDRPFAGSDVLATAYALSQGINKCGKYDLVICGKQTTDGDTAQVGAELAEFLDIPHITNVSSVLHVRDNSLTVEMDLSHSVETAEIKFPCLITVEAGIFQPRLPSYVRKKETADWEIKSFSLKDLNDSDPMNYGLKGSSTQVIRIFPPESNDDHEKWTGNDDFLAEKLFRKLKDAKMLIGKDD